jgi:hypothetical protein
VLLRLLPGPGQPVHGRHGRLAPAAGAGLRRGSPLSRAPRCSRPCPGAGLRRGARWCSCRAAAAAPRGTGCSCSSSSHQLVTPARRTSSSHQLVAPARRTSSSHQLVAPARPDARPKRRAEGRP